MSEEMIIRHCAPTLAGLKTGNLFSCACASRGELTAALRILNNKLVPKGIRVIPLRWTNGRALIYVYRSSGLKRDLSDAQARALLEENGYVCERADSCIMRLIERIGTSEEFPHEIGLFLSYPPEDVCAFIEKKACDHKCVGCWKVYGDVDAAQRTFARYEKCTRVYGECFRNGRTLERLTVAG